MADFLNVFMTIQAQREIDNCQLPGLLPVV